jgi:hypothetical protein
VRHTLGISRTQLLKVQVKKMRTLQQLLSTSHLLHQGSSITNVLHVDSLSYNLLSVSQLYEMGYNCLFTNKDMEVFRRENSSIIFMGRLKNKLYLVNFNKSKANLQTCLVVKSCMG